MSKKSKDTKTLPTCECGCGATTRGGRYVPGHDARRRRDLIESALGGSKRAETILRKLGWSHFLDAKRAKQAINDVARKVMKRPNKENAQPTQKLRRRKATPDAGENVSPAPEAAAADATGISP